MVAAYYSMPLHRDTLVWVPLLMDTWRMRELTIVSILVTKLLLWRAVLHQETVSLSALLGGVDVEGHDLCFCIPHANFNVYTVSNHDQLKDRVQLTEMLDNDPSKWAFLGQGNLGPGSWLLLKHK